ncbi:hypothetical protein LOC54_03785 [Acetobacter sp. AN02]|uniref:glycoside hydrolase family 108 protein n=1 Tax=Acetobacter sp. AN02 TaxID=2894186 RepID=UPI0024340F01|nr:glycosyl hydrolase 108 family protein [Acetobacter sp. AN02]MDG6094241.1 hypothetical protein [Acetobacter sp. AN02]
MTGQNFNACLDFVRTAEGGYSSDPKDPGNWITPGKGQPKQFVGSRYGVSAPVLAAWLHPQPVTADMMRTLDVDTFGAIARSRYWNPLSASAFPAGIDLMLFDFGWNCGVGSSAILLQRMVGALPDGVIGRRTLDAFDNAAPADILPQISPESLTTLHSRLGLPPSSGIGPEVQRAICRRGGLPAVMVLVLSGMQEREYRTRAGFRRYGRGWLARTRRRTETALAMVSAEAARSPDGCVLTPV